MVSASRSRCYLSHVLSGVTLEVSALILSRLRSVIHLAHRTLLNLTQAPVESYSFAITMSKCTTDDDTDDTDDSNINALLRQIHIPSLATTSSGTPARVFLYTVSAPLLSPSISTPSSYPTFLWHPTSSPQCNICNRDLRRPLIHRTSLLFVLATRLLYFLPCWT